MKQEKLLIFTDSNIYSDEFAKTWQGKGYTLKHLPLLHAENIEVVFNNDQIYGVIITSANAIFSLKKYFPDKDINIYTISKGLAEKIKAENYQNIYFEIDSKDASGLEKTFAKYLPQGMLVHLCGERVRQPLNFKDLHIQALPVYKMHEVAANAAELKQIVAINKDALIYVSSEQAIEVILKYQISFNKVIFKSDYLKNFANSF